MKWTIASVLVSVLAVGGLSYGLTRLTARNGKKIQKQYLLLNEIAYPNIEYTTWGWEPTSNFSGKFYSNRIKDVDGITIPFIKYEGEYSIFHHYDLNQDEALRTGDDGKSDYTYQENYKIPRFYDVLENENVFYKQKQDLDFIPDMTNQAVEVAITFDEGYTLEEISKMIPDSLKMNWIWIGVGKQGFVNGNLAYQYGFTPHFDQGLTAEQQNAMTKEVNQALTKNSKAEVAKIYRKYEQEQKVTPLVGMQNSFTIFADNAQKFLAMRGDESDSKELVALKDFLAQNKDAVTAKFAGVILTGRAENFAQLKDVKWIFASNIGQSVEIQPYHHLEK